MSTLTWILLGVVFAPFCSWLAWEKGRTPIGWLFLGLGFNIVALLALIGAPANGEKGLDPDLKKRRPGSAW